MDNHPAFTKDNRELFSDLTTNVYSLSQIFQDYPEDNRCYILAKEFVESWNRLSDYITAD